jgi:serine/threonine protein kinase
MIFNLGHDSAADVWSIGVLLYEMFMLSTPFAPKRPDNITELFTNIALVKVRG